MEHRTRKKGIYCTQPTLRVWCPLNELDSSLRSGDNSPFKQQGPRAYDALWESLPTGFNEDPTIRLGGHHLCVESLSRGASLLGG